MKTKNSFDWIEFCKEYNIEYTFQNVQQLSKMLKRYLSKNPNIDKEKLNENSEQKKELYKHITELNYNGSNRFFVEKPHWISSREARKKIGIDNHWAFSQLMKRNNITKYSNGYYDREEFERLNNDIQERKRLKK